MNDVRLMKVPVCLRAYLHTCINFCHETKVCKNSFSFSSLKYLSLKQWKTRMLLADFQSANLKWMRRRRRTLCILKSNWFLRSCKKKLVAEPSSISLFLCSIFNNDRYHHHHHHWCSDEKHWLVTIHATVSHFQI